MSDPVTGYVDDPSWDGERCRRCGRGYRDVYWIEDAVWNATMGGSAGMLCPTCFARTYAEANDVYKNTREALERP